MSTENLLFLLKHPSLTISAIFESAKKKAEELLDLFKGTKCRDYCFAEALYLTRKSLEGLGEKIKPGNTFLNPYLWLERCA